MEIRVLGPLEVLAAGSPLNLGGKQRRTLFAILAVNAGRSVSTHQLIDELWGDSPPEAARKSVQAHVAHLRKALNTDREALSSTNGGYVLEFEPDALDIHRFERLFEEGKQLQQTDPRGAVEKLDQALVLFRGAPLAGLADEAHSLRVETSRLEELRSAAIEERLEALIRSGGAARAAAEAERLVAEFPLRERLWSLLMLSLYLSGRQGEALRAFSRARQALAEELGIEPSAELRDLEQRILDQDPALDDPESGIASKPAVVAGAVRNPYKGLRPFDEADAADFFGRDGLIRRLLERVEDRTSSSLVVLAGPSGAGKSSAVRAGLIPKLRDRGNAVAVMFPGADPMAALAKTITEITGDSPAEILERLGSGDPVIDGILIVDQLEEIFTMARSAEDVDRFLKVVTGAESSIRSVVATIRADFLNHLLAHPRTGAILEEALVLVPPLQSHEIEAAVVGPAERIRVSVDPELVQRIATDVQAKSAALPLLQFALTDCFERRRDDSLSIADYERAGGITGALARRADQLYEALDAEHQQGVRQLFLHLVSITDDEERIRRRVTWKTLLSLGNDPDVMGKVIERFGSQRLLTFDQDSETGEATVEVAHEALIAEWPTLASWVDAARDDLRMRQRLLAARREWEESGGDESFLLRGSRLAEMEAWQEVSDLDLPETAALFLEKSRQVEDAAASRRSRRRTSIVTVLVAAGLVASVLASVAISQQTAAEEQARILLAGDLASAANVNLDVDPELSILLALEAAATTRSADGTVLRVAEEALHRAVMSHRLLDRISHEGEGIAHFSPDGISFLSSGEDENVVDVWSVESLERKLTLTGHTDAVIDAVFDPSGDRIATTSDDGTVRVWDAASGRSEAVFPVGGSPKVPAFSNDGRLLAATADTTTWMWDLESEEETWVADPPGGIPINLAFSPDDSLLAVTRAGDGEVNDVSALVYDVNTGGSVRTLEGHDAQDVGFTPDGSRVLTAGADGTVRIWDTGSGEHLDTYTGHRGSVSDLQISADGTMVASSGAVDVQVWDLSTLELEAELFGHTGEVWAIDLNLDAELLLTATKADRTTRLWDLSPNWSHELLGLPGSRGCVGCAFPSVAAGLAYSPDGVTLASSGEAGLVNVWDAITGAERHAIETAGPLYRLDIDPGGSFLATAGPAGAELHDINSGESVATLVTGVETLDAEFGPNGLLATASFDGVRLWETLRGPGELIYDLNGVFSVAFDPSGTVLAMSIVEESLKGFIEIRDLGSGETKATLTEHSPNIVKKLTFDSTGDLLVTASDDTTAIIWDTATFEPVHQLEGHGTAVVSADFDPSRPEVATAGLDGTVKIWNVETGNLRLTLPAQGALSDIGYSPDGRYLAATGPDGFVTVYMLDIDQLVSEAERRLTRWWSEAECRQYLDSGRCPPAPERLNG